jgi:hypothetical protein
MIHKAFRWANIGAAAGLIVLFFAVNYSGKAELPSVVAIIVVFFALLNQFLYNQLQKANAKSPQRFVTAFTGTIAIKLFAAMGVALATILLDKPHKLELAVSILVIYSAFTLVLIRHVVKQIQT